MAEIRKLGDLRGSLLDEEQHSKVYAVSEHGTDALPCSWRSAALSHTLDSHRLTAKQSQQRRDAVSTSRSVQDIRITY